MGKKNQEPMADNLREMNDKAISMAVDTIVSEEDLETRKELKEKYIDNLLSERSEWERKNDDSMYSSGKFVGCIKTCAGIIAGCELLKIGTALWSKFKKK